MKWKYIDMKAWNIREEWATGRERWMERSLQDPLIYPAQEDSGERRPSTPHRETAAKEKVR